MTTTSVDLRAEAEAEVRRITASRSLLRDGDERLLAELETDGPWIVIPRRASLRRVFGRRVCLVWWAAVEDGSGRIVESRVVPVVAPWPVSAANRPAEASARRAWMRSILGEIEIQVRPHVESACADWRIDVTRTARAFSTARLIREHAIARGIASIDTEVQPGLFDRRADRVASARESAAAELARTASERLRAVEAIGARSHRPARLALVLVP